MELLTIITGLKPLMSAAVAGNRAAVEYLLSRDVPPSREDGIDALKLLGATLVDKSDDLAGAAELWKRAMDKR
jgi:hypothetical protein